ncbi:benzoate/H(+) symporter BenE family transporter [Paenibacillus mucilaginosus]|uniref:benzoate/H(+) symporter BenE family transporter n=1 Tax=Paenibacillus mucilaginosus TaxID=61624 RepID=UPI0022A95231|nr:benzoate/H(+) symporter BenE family transporter [Paenibacillus mucilaginosus]
MQNAAAGLMSALMACTAGAVMLVQAADAAGMTREHLLSWILIVYLTGGALNLALSLKYKLPFAGAHSITAAAFLSSVVAGYPPGELAGSFMMAGALIAVLGVTGLFARIMEAIPRSLIDAMLAGLVLPYVLKVVPSVTGLPLAGGLALLGYFLAPRVVKNLPPFIGALGLGLAGLLLGHSLPAAAPADSLSWPEVSLPVFTWSGLLAVAIPVAFLVLGNDIAVALAALRKNGYQAPVNRVIMVSGLGTLFVGFLGGHAVSIGGVMTSLCSGRDAGAPQSRYKAAVICSVLVAFFGLFAWLAVGLIERLPPAFVSLMTGLSLAGILLNSIRSALSQSAYRLSSLLAFAVAASGVTWAGISSPVWALIIGLGVSRALQEGRAGRTTQQSRGA